MEKEKNVGLLLILAGAAAWFLLKPGSGTGSDKKGALLSWAQTTGSTSNEIAHFTSAITYMTVSEISSTYDYVFNYIKKGTRPPQGSPLYNAILAISSKYDIFS